MNIGGKIKKLRTAKLMTQSDLAGEEITRNMLSRIENGSANPSLETICYLAKRLHVSPGFLLTEEEDEGIYFKKSETDAIKRAMREGNYQIAADMCRHTECGEDDELRMILAECNLSLAIEAFYDGRLRECATLLDEAVDAGEKCFYRMDHISATAAVYFWYMCRISATLDSNVLDEELVNVFPAMNDAFCRYAMILKERSSEEGDGGLVRALEALTEGESAYTLHLDAEKWMEEGDFKQAYELLHRILIEEIPVPKPVLYFVFCDLEVCCREREDFKGAYEYANNKLVILQQMLS
ncbi:MAG: helix-turn-helix transcriptional regulator [Clostridia bacterium]|nr:helix-turn-helix transcriptional regulator [Clostridia bacterium]